MSGMGVNRFLRERLFLVGAVERVDKAAARMWRIRIGGLPEFSWRPGQQVRLHVGDLFAQVMRMRPHDALRTYSIWDAGSGWLDLVLLDHGHDQPDAPGARWMRAASPGVEVTLSRPEGSFVVRPGAPYHLFAGEETASVAFGAMLRELRAAKGARVYGVVEGETAADHLELPVELGRLEREGASAADSQVLPAAVRALELPHHPGVAYLAGEARTIQRIRAHLVQDRGWNRRDILTKPFWTPGKRGME
ncbi:siderophore-interacting protein [Streptosporangiaceae bacterium NEAU-GS5]|nr:siderophore-interacting protein [Streptosporangiaceae bacterium NEAU-GS5]